MDSAQVRRFRVMSRQMAARSAHSFAAEPVHVAYRTGEALFDHAAPMAVGRRFGLVKPDNLGTTHSALLVAVIAWLPLVVLTALPGLWTGTDGMNSLLREVGVHARYLFAAPLLVAAGAVCAPQLGFIAHHFVDSGIVDTRDASAVNDVIAKTRRLVRLPAADVVMIALAYLVAVAAAASYAPDQLPAWARPAGGMPRYSLAGWWHTLVSLPLLLVLIFGWFWRLALWTQLLWRVSRLTLRLVASHPDHCAGLGILSRSVAAFAVVGMALSTIVAGRAAHIVLDGGALPTQHVFVNIGLMAAVLALFVAPLLVFVPALLETWRHATFEYGAFAGRVGHAFEQTWLGARKAEADAFERPDFSATADLYGVVANVHAMRFLPLDLKDLIALAAAMALPFVPVVLLAFPLDSIWAQLKSLLL